MPVAVIAEKSATPRIIRPKALHAVGHSIPRRRLVVAGLVVAGRGVIRTGAVIVGSREHPAYDRTTKQSCTHTPPRAVPSSSVVSTAVVSTAVSSAAPLHGLDVCWGSVLDSQSIRDRHRRCNVRKWRNAPVSYTHLR